MKSRKTPSVLSIVVVVVLAIYYLIAGRNQTGGSPTPLAPTLASNNPTSLPATTTSNGVTASAPATASNNSTPAIGQRSKTSGCVSANAMPDPACTPGDILPDATTDQICQSGYSSKVRNVPDSEKNAVYAEYGIASHTPGQYEVDHLISLELGGSNDISNLWPEPADPRPGFHEKDKVENYLHSQVCSGAMSLRDAQIKIATDWLSVYNKMP